MFTRVTDECAECGAATVYTFDRWGTGTRSHADGSPGHGPARMVDPVVVCGDCGSRELTTRWLGYGDETICAACNASNYRSIGD